LWEGAPLPANYSDQDVLIEDFLCRERAVLFVLLYGIAL